MKTYSLQTATTKRWIAVLFIAGTGLLTGTTAQATLTFTNTFDGTWGSELTIGQTAVANAETILSGIFYSPVNVAITFSYGSGPGGGAYASPNFYNGTSIPYATLKADLQSASNTNPANTILSSLLTHLPVSSPSTIPFLLPSAEAQALGLGTGGNSSAGTVTVGNGSTWDPTESDGITANQGDLTGVLMHEISHVLGRVDYSFASQPPPDLTPLDLSRYSVPAGTFNFTNSNAVFSIDGGATSLADYSPTSDTGDWGGVQTASNDANNAFFSYGTTLQWTAVDTKVMQAQGWETTAPEPGSITLALLGGLGLLNFRRRARL